VGSSRERCVGEEGSGEAYCWVSPTSESSRNLALSASGWATEMACTLL